MPNEYTGAAIVKAAQRIPDNVARRQEARQQVKLAEAKFKQYEAEQPKRNAQLEVDMQTLKNDLYKSQAEGLKNKVFGSLDRYEGSKDVKFLNNMLTEAKSNPIGQRMFNNTVRFDPLTRTPEAEAQLAAMGLTDADGFFADPNAMANFTVVTRPDGSQEIHDLDKIYAMTGYTKHMNAEQLEQMETRAKIMQMMRKGKNAGDLTALERVARQWADSDPDLTFVEAYRKLNEGGTKTAGTQAERYAQRLRESNPDMSYVESMQQAVQDLSRGTKNEREARLNALEKGTDFKTELAEVNKRTERTTDQKKFDEINEVKDALDEQFADQGGFLNADLSDPKVRQAAQRQIMRIEQEFPMSAADRKIAGEIKQLTAFADIVEQEITDAETGPLDSLLRGVKKYVSNDVEGLAGVSAYEAYRNTMRRAMAGTAQSAQETANFNKSMGSLLQQTGPVLEQFKIQTLDLKNKLQAIYDMNDPYVAKVRLNMNMDKIADIIIALDERLEMFDSVPIDKETVKPGEVKQTVDEYFPEPAKKDISEYFN